MERNQGRHTEPHLNFDVLRHVCNCLTRVSDALSFSLTCSALRKGALQRRLWISPVVLSSSESIGRFHTFIFGDAAALASCIYGLSFAAFYYDLEDEDARNRSEAATGYLVALLESATRLQSLHLQTAAGDRVLIAAAQVATLRELLVLSEGYDGGRLPRFLSTLQSPLRRLRIATIDPDDFRASFLHGSLTHLAPTLEVLELEDFPLDLSPSSIITPFTALRTLETKVISFVSCLDVLWWLFPHLDTLVVGHLDRRFTGDNYPAVREQSKEAQKTCAWPALDHTVCEADMAFMMALQCPIRRMDLTVSDGQSMRRLEETLRDNCPRQLRLSLRFDHGLRAVDALFPPEIGEKLTHLVIIANINVKTADTVGHHWHVSWTQFVDRLMGWTGHLCLTHLRIVFHYKIHQYPRATSSASCPENSVRETDLQLIAARLLDTVPTLQHVFLTHCGRMWAWAGSCTRLHSKWSASGAWCAAGADEDNNTCPPNPGLKRSPCVEISRPEGVMDREELQLTQREEDMIRSCSDSRSD
ncbi:hypothetical protein V8D89_006363 [Ganoderma adspersum]